MYTLTVMYVNGTTIQLLVCSENANGAILDGLLQMNLDSLDGVQGIQIVLVK